MNGKAVGHSSVSAAALGRALAGEATTTPGNGRPTLGLIKERFHAPVFQWPPFLGTLVERNPVLVMSEPCVEGLQVWIECATDT